MEQINRIELAGTIGSARINTYSGREILHATVATNYIYKDKTGCCVIETTWTNITYWAKSGEDLTCYTKGSKVHLFGRLKNTKYMASDGTERSATEVAVNSLELIEE